MAILGIPTPGTAVTASTGDDQVFFFSNTAQRNLSANTVLGLAGDDIISIGAQGYTAYAVSNLFVSGAGSATTTGTVLSANLVGSSTYSTSKALTDAASAFTVAKTGVITSQGGARSAFASQIYGNEGNDSIFLGVSMIAASAFTVGGGAGNDLIGNYTYINGVIGSGSNAAITGLTAATIQNSFFEGGGGNDVLDFTYSASTLSAVTMQGSQGDDQIRLIATGGNNVISASRFLGGGGNDVISLTIDSAGKSSIYGGGGNDSIMYSADSLSASYIDTDYNGADAQYDGSDILSGTFASSYNTNTIVAGGGNDSIFLTVAEDSQNSIYLNGGDDYFRQATVALSASSVYGGAGNDTVNLTGMEGNALVMGGGGNDNIDLIGSGQNHAGTIFGGEGADIIGSALTINTGAQVGVLFGYSSTTESTLAAMDTIAVTNSAGAFQYNYTPGGLSLATFSATGVTATNGTVVFTSTFDNNVTARVEAINTLASTTGSVAAFYDGDNKQYLFIQGGAVDLVTRNGLGTAIVSTGTTLALSNGNKNVTITYA